MIHMRCNTNYFRLDSDLLLIMKHAQKHYNNMHKNIIVNDINTYINLTVDTQT